MYQYPDYLQHYGVRGMKWGVRKRSRRSSGSSDYRTARKLKKKGVKNLSNKELQTLNQRQSLENTYRQNNPSAIKRATKFISRTAGAIGTVGAIYGATKNGWIRDGTQFVKQYAHRKQRRLT